MTLTIDLSQGESHWLLRLVGDLDYGECASFRMSIDRILKSAPPSTIVDLSGLEYLDSSGLGLLLSLSALCAAQAAGGRVFPSKDLPPLPETLSGVFFGKSNGAILVAGDCPKLSLIVPFCGKSLKGTVFELGS